MKQKILTMNATLKFLILSMKQKILIYLCMNAIFSRTMQDTETQISQFILVGASISNEVSNCQ